MRVLPDTHALFWWHNQAQFSFAAGVAMLRARSEQQLLVSSISAWEIAVANTKANLSRRPALAGMSPAAWFHSAIAALQPEVEDVSPKIALEAANVGLRYGSHDPGDCILLATAHLFNAALVTRDMRILAFAKAEPHYVSVVRC